MMARILFIAACLFALPVLAAIHPSEKMKDPALESVAATMYRDIRCAVCQGQSIAESDADIAKDMRGIIRERLLAGDSREQIQDWLRARYGDGILMKPPFSGSTMPLWLAPFAVFAGGAIAVRRLFRRRQA